MAARKIARTSAHDVTRFDESVQPAVHQRLQRVRCTRCGECVDDDRLAQARHLALSCRRATAEDRAAASVVLSGAPADPDREEDAEPVLTPTRSPLADERRALLAELLADRGERLDPAPADAEMRDETRTLIEVAALEDAAIWASREHSAPTLVRDLWAISCLDLPVDARLELRRLAEAGDDPGLLYYAACLHRFGAEVRS
jgi:hypothetical protein